MIMPNSNESSESEFSNENQQNIINRNLNLLRNNNNNNNTNNNNNNPNNSNNKNIINTNSRHQNFSKNIYIGTRNAEKWDSIRTALSFKNDVEFVSYLLNLAEKEQIRNNGNPNKSDRQQSPFSRPPTETSQSSLYQPSIKKSRKVQFHEELNGLENPLPSKEQRKLNKKQKLLNDTTILRKRIPPPPNDLIDTTSQNENPIDLKTENNIIIEPNCPDEEVLDCRIEEKIKSEIRVREQQQTKHEISKEFIQESSTSSSNIESDKNDDENENDEILCLTMKNLKEMSPASDNRKLLPVKFKKKKKKKIEKLLIETKLSHSKNLVGTLKLKIKHDIRKAPQDAKLLNQNDEDNNSDDLDDLHTNSNVNENYDDENSNENDFKETNDDKDEILSNTSKSSSNKCCRDCNMKHNKNECPITNPSELIRDTINLTDWMEKNKDIVLEEEKQHENDLQIKSEELETGDDDDDDDEDDGEDESVETSSNLSNGDLSQHSIKKIDEIEPQNQQQHHQQIIQSQPTFSEASLPDQFELRLTEELGIFTKTFLPKYTQLGPIIGLSILETDIVDDCNMKFMIETFDGTKSYFLSLENKNKSNWLRYIRPALNRDLRNATLIFKDKYIYFVTCLDIEAGCELLYWSDENNSAWDKKKIDRTNCGGCNLKFDHPLYYRTHCSVFHDPAFSLTIRKYHCKVCGIAVLGKENIMKHAAQMHEGKGAYQCQYCKKYFLRLNYLEMHRTYGCSANPQRARPLCDFCGRKFCQPQKLKVHIKRMHSDMAEVLRDFQCKLCSKLLGSRAALQRHSKEVHSRNSTVVSCPRCQKLFQNRSNLKIHMLTHSGVRPFRCIVPECSAAFTTKQCLQFHYKKVHGYAQEQMPKIERSVAYTFDAYSGGMKIDVNAEPGTRRRRRSLDYDSSLLNPENDENEENSFPAQKDTNDLLKQHHASISEICKNETNLSLLSTTISSFLNQEINRAPLRDDSDDESDNDGNNSMHSENIVKTNERDYNIDKEADNLQITKSIEDHHVHHQESELHAQESQHNMPEQISHQHHHPHHPLQQSDHHQQHHQHHHHHQQQQQNAQLSLVESFLSENSSRLNLEAHDDDLTMMSSTSNNNLDKHSNNYRIPENLKVQEFVSAPHQNLVASKGSKKWINNDLTDNNDLSVNRDFLTKLMMSGSHHGDDNDDDDNSTILDVVETNHNQYNSPSIMGTPDNLTQIQQHISSPQIPPHHHHLHHQSNLVSGFYNTSRQIGSISTSASMLVEAALSTVSNIIDDRDSCSLKNNTNNDDENLSNMNVDIDTPNVNEHHLNHVEFENERNYHHQNSFIQSPINNNLILKDNNDIDVDSVSTPAENFTNHATPSPRAISPGQDYPIMYASSHHHLPISNCRRGYSMLDNHMGGGGGSNGGGNGGDTSPQSLPRYDFNNITRRKRDEHQLNQLSSDDENSIIVAQNLSVNNHHNDNSSISKLKLPHSQIDMLYSKYNNESVQGNMIPDDNVNDLNETRLKYNGNHTNSANNNNHNNTNSSNNEQGMDISEFRSNSSNETISDFQGVDMSSRSILGSYHNPSNFQIQSSGVNLSLNRYHHHIYDILSDRDQQNDQHQLPQIQQQQQQQMQHLMQDQMNDEQPEQPTSVDLSRTASYVVASPPPPPLPYSHSHSDMLRMVSLDLTPNSSSGMLVGSNSHLRHSSSILASHPIQHNSRESLSIDHNRLISSEQLSTNHRLLVDPTAHLLMEQNSRLISENRILDQTSRLLVDPGPNRHMVPSRGFGAYHHQVNPTNYHHSSRPGLSSPHSTNPSNYHPFSAYY